MEPVNYNICKNTVAWLRLDVRLRADFAFFCAPDNNSLCILEFSSVESNWPICCLVRDKDVIGNESTKSES